MRGLPAIIELAISLQRRIDLHCSVRFFEGAAVCGADRMDGKGIVWPVGAYMNNRLRAGCARGTGVRGIEAPTQAGTFN